MTDNHAHPPGEVNVARLHKAVRQRLQSLSRAGLTHLHPASDRRDNSNNLPIPKDPGIIETPLAPSPSAVATDQSADVPQTNTATTDQTEDAAMPCSQQIQLDVLSQEVAACTACDELAATRRHTVFGVGNPDARLLFYGEAPGADEDRQGEPFVGRAGKKLNEIIQAMGIKRADVYILNTIKCRPPGNRNPSPEEQQNCSGFLKRQLEIIKPEYIVCLGAVAAKSFLQVQTAIGALRGRFHIQDGIKVLCTYHPAYILRNPSKKREVWEDIKFLMQDMGLKIPDQYA